VLHNEPLEWEISVTGGGKASGMVPLQKPDTKRKACPFMILGTGSSLKYELNSLKNASAQDILGRVVCWWLEPCLILLISLFGIASKRETSPTGREERVE
jgi:hypothetical protein